MNARVMAHGEVSLGYYIEAEAVLSDSQLEVIIRDPVAGRVLARYSTQVEAIHSSSMIAAASLLAMRPFAERTPLVVVSLAREIELERKRLQL